MVSEASANKSSSFASTYYEDSISNSISIASAVVSSYGATAVTVLHDEETTIASTMSSSHHHPNVHNVEDYSSLLSAQEAIDTTTTYSSSSSPTSLVCRDLPFALLFYLHLAIFLWLGLDIAPKGFDALVDGLLQNQNQTATNVWDGFADEIRKTKSDDDFTLTEENIVEMQRFLTLAFEYLKVYPQRMVWSIAVPTAVFAFVFSLSIALLFFQRFPRTMVYTCLIESFVLVAAVLIWACWASHWSLVVSFLTLVSLAATLYYVAAVAWRGVPFAAVNLKVAVRGVASNCGLFDVAFSFICLGILWAVYWLYVVIGVAAYYNKTQCAQQQEQPYPDSYLYASSHNNKNATSSSSSLKIATTFDIDDDDDGDCDPPLSVVLLFLLSLYWTTTITMNLIQITVAGVIGTWCYAKEDANSCCSLAIFMSCFRSLTYSFGSVCLGSLLQGFVRVFRFVVEQARDQRDRNDGISTGYGSGGASSSLSCLSGENSCCCCCCGGLFLCILECIASLLEDIIYVFNQYAYIYAGIYGLSYLESGRKVMDLFRARGWTTIVTDNLVGYVLSYTTFTTGFVSGIVGVWLEHLVNSYMEAKNNDNDSYVFGPLPNPRAWAFAIGFLMGTWVCAIMMNVVKGAVNTILVCWADSPTIFEINHPALCQEMADSWTSVFPEIHVYVGSSSSSPTAYYSR